MIQPQRMVQLYLFSYYLSKDFYSLHNLLFGREAEVQPHVVRPGVIGIKSGARHEGYLLLDCLREQLGRVEVLGQRSPDKEPALRVRPARPVSYTHLRAHETRHEIVCRLLLEKKK